MTAAELRAAILAANDRPVSAEPIPVPEWGVSFHVRALSLHEMEAMRAEFAELKEIPPARWVIALACDAEGERIFAPSDAALLGQKSPDVVARLCSAFLRASGLTAKAVEDAEGN
jgi:hypothetical protein